jgi:hypothetical protein
VKKCWWVLSVGLMVGLMAWGQLTQIPNASQIGIGREHAPEDEPSVTRDMQAHQLKRLRAEHQKQMMQDTERLVQLATTFKADVEKGDQASNDALKNVDEIGKLAKRVSERIKNQ